MKLPNVCWPGRDLMNGKQNWLPSVIFSSGKKKSFGGIGIGLHSG